MFSSRCVWALFNAYLGLALVRIHIVLLVGVQALCQRQAVPHAGYQREFDHRADEVKLLKEVQVGPRSK